MVNRFQQGIREETVFLTKGAGTTGYQHAKNKAGHLPHTICKTLHQNSSEVSIRAKTIKPLKENIANLHDLGYGDGFLDLTPKTYATKEKVDKSNYNKIRNFCATNNTIKKVKQVRNHNLLWKKRKTIYRIGGNICKSYLIKDWYLEYIKNFS